MVLTYIALSFGFSLMVNVWIFYRISGGLFNPAVTLGMVMVKSLSYTRGVLLVCAQLTGSIFASLIVKVLFPVNFNVRTTLSPGTSLVQGVFVEALLTAELVFAIFMLAKEKHRATYLAPIGIGIALFVAQLAGNLAWTPLFFGAHRIAAAFLLIVAILGLSILTTIVFAQIRRPAAWLRKLSAAPLSWSTTLPRNSTSPRVLNTATAMPSRSGRVTMTRWTT